MREVRVERVGREGREARGERGGLDWDGGFKVAPVILHLQMSL